MDSCRLRSSGQLSNKCPNLTKEGIYRELGLSTQSFGKLFEVSCRSRWHLPDLSANTLFMMSNWAKEQLAKRSIGASSLRVYFIVLYAGNAVRARLASQAGTSYSEMQEGLAHRASWHVVSCPECWSGQGKGLSRSSTIHWAADAAYGLCGCVQWRASKAGEPGTNNQGSGVPSRPDQ